MHSQVGLEDTSGIVVYDTSLLLPEEDMQWWSDARFGLFIHYGLYSVLGEGEWAMFKQRINVAEYSKLKDKFTAEKFSGKQWVEAAKKAGCKYMVVTAQHHDGFCLFDTKVDDYNSMNAAVKTDLIGEYVEAAHQADMRVGIYYSPLDWRFPGFFFPEMYRPSAEAMKAQTYGKLRELMTNYGDIDILWYDGGQDNWLGLGGLMWNPKRGGWYTRGYENTYTGTFSWEPVKLNTMVRELQPKIVISERSGWMGDFITYDSHMKGDTARPFELCTTMGGGYGWTPEVASQVKSLDNLIRQFVMVACVGGNYLLNVAPKPDGEIEAVQMQRLKEIGEFLSKYGESIYSTKGGIYDEEWGGTTISDEALYVHVLKTPSDGKLHLPNQDKKIASARYMSDHSKLKFTQSDTGIELSNIVNKQNEIDLVIKLTYK